MQTSLFLVVACIVVACFAVPNFSSTCAKLCLVQAVKKETTNVAKCYKSCVAEIKQANALMDTLADSDQTMKATTALNVRAGPCTDKKIIGSVAAGATVTFSGAKQSGCGYTWYQVRGSFGSGWAASKYLQQAGSSKPNKPAPTPSKPAPKPSKPAPSSSGSGSFSAGTLKKVFPLLPASKADLYFPYLNAAMNAANINTCKRRAAFLAQLGHESGQLRWFEEFASGAAYEGRKDLGNTHPGDGKRYKGRGPIQLTGRANYRAAGKALGVDLEGNPTLAATKEWGFKIATWFWNTRGLSSYADQGTQAAFDQITRRINGGFNGKTDRDSLWHKFKSQLGC